MPKPHPIAKTMAMPLLDNLGNEATTGLESAQLDPSWIIVGDSCMFHACLF